MATYEDWLNESTDNTAPPPATPTASITYGNGTLDSWLNPPQDSALSAFGKGIKVGGDTFKEQLGGYLLKGAADAEAHPLSMTQGVNAADTEGRSYFGVANPGTEGAFNDLIPTIVPKSIIDKATQTSAQNAALPNEYADYAQQVVNQGKANAAVDAANVKPGSAADWAYAGGKMVPMIGGLLAGEAIAPAIATPLAATLFGATGAGGTYLNQVENGATPTQASNAADVSGTFNALTTFIPGAEELPILNALSKSTIGKYVAAGLHGEAISQLLNAEDQGINKLTIDPNMTAQQFASSATSPDVIMGGAAGILGHAVGEGINKVVNKVTGKAETPPADTNPPSEPPSTTPPTSELPANVGAPSALEASPPAFVQDPNNPDKLIPYVNPTPSQSSEISSSIQNTIPPTNEGPTAGGNGNGIIDSNILPQTSVLNNPVQYPTNIPPISNTALNINPNTEKFSAYEKTAPGLRAQTGLPEGGAIVKRSPETGAIQLYPELSPVRTPSIDLRTGKPTIDPNTINLGASTDNSAVLPQISTSEPPQTRAPASQQALLDDFNSRKELVSHYLDVPQIQTAANEGVLSDGDLHNMALIEMTSGAKDRDKYLNGILKGKDVSDLVPNDAARLLTTQERQDLSNNGETPINQPTATAGAAAITARLNDVQATLESGQQAYNIAADAKARLARLAEKTGYPVDTINPERDLSIVAPDWKAATRRALGELFRTEYALNELQSLRPQEQSIPTAEAVKSSEPLAPTDLSDALEAVKKGNTKDIDRDLIAHLDDRNFIYTDHEGNPTGLTPFGERVSRELQSPVVSPLKEEALAQVPAKTEEVPFSVTPTTEVRDRGQLDKIKQDVVSTAQRINPKVDVRFADQLFGEGPALIRSGAETTERQEVAGSYDKLNNLIDISTNLDKFDPTDTAHHELFHSIEGLLTPEEQSALNAKYPGTDKLSPDEHKATAFADWARGKMANTPMGIRSIFAKIANVLKQLGNVFKRNKIQSADDVFQKVFSGEVGKRATDAINSADVGTLRTASSELLQHAAANSKAPELADIMKSPVSPSDSEALQRLAVQSAGTPIEKAYSLGHDVNTGEVQDPKETMTKMVHATKEALSQVASPEYVNKVYGEQEAALHAINHEAAEDIFKQKTVGRQAVEALNHVGRGILQSNDGVLRWMAKAKNSEMVRNIANMFLANPGANEHHVETFHEERQKIMTDGYNTIHRALKNIPDNEQHRVTYFLQHPEQWTHHLYDPAVHAASQIARWIDLTRQEFIKLGIPINTTQGFFPRVYEISKILDNPKAFRADAFKAYSEALREEIAKPGMNQAEINAAINDRIDRWMNNLALQHIGISSKANDFQVFTSAPTAPSSLKSRVFEKAADDILRKWLVQDPTEAMAGYVYQASRAIPWERRFGGDKWTEMKQNLINEGLDGDEINTVTKIIKSNTGQLGEPLSKGAKTITSGLRTLASLAYLAHVTFKHLSYPIYMGIRTGNLGNTLRGFSSSGKAMLNTQFGTVSPKMELLKSKMEMAALMGEAAERAFLEANMGGTPQDMLSSINKKWYDNIGITHLMQSMKLAAADTTQYTIAKLANDVHTNSSLTKSAQTLLRGMGVPNESMADFAHWVTNIKDSTPAQAWESSQDPNAELYRLALRRGLDQTIVNPNPATAQRWASHPIAGMAYSLSRFMMGLTKQLVIPVTKQAGEAFQPGYTIGDRFRLAAPMMMMPLMAAFTRGYNAIWDELEPTDKDVYHPGKKRTEAQQWTRALFESDMFGQASKPMHELSYLLGNAIDPKATAKLMDKPYASSSLGPIAELLQREGTMLYKLPDLYKQTGNTVKDNMAQRQELTASYNLVVKPALSGAVSTLTPEIARPLAFAAIQVINSPQARRAFVNTLARKRVQ